MKYAFYLGCTIPARSRNYELSARKVAEKLDIELVDIDDFICCGFPMKAGDQISSEVMAAYNLSIAQEKGLSICTLCSSCASALSEAAHKLAKNDLAREQVNKELSKVGLEYRGGVKVRHFARILFEEIEEEKIKEQFLRDLSDLSIAAHYGCHYLKPSEIHDDFDNVEDPKSIETLVSLTGAKIIDYPGKKRCCGGPVLPVDEKLALSVSKEKLDDLSKTDADALCLVCPFCSVMYDGNQKSIESEYGVSYNLPVLYLTQILGLAMGVDRKELGLNMNVVKTKDLLSKYFPKE
ncbi:MAG: CoB--CoM heterodisulfide reductase iron-sulfur subunit B family protein [Deltaproteobacteria bacterium]|nr:CoB--CoM heterodisulfide reductase iron-sulfur subunit B family protein [Deltaproteobacteria bacterium]